MSSYDGPPMLRSSVNRERCDERNPPHAHPVGAGAEFLQMFMRMDYALKEAGEFADGDAKVWNRIAVAIENAFCDVADKEPQAKV